MAKQLVRGRGRRHCTPWGSGNFPGNSNKNVAFDEFCRLSGTGLELCKPVSNTQDNFFQWEFALHPANNVQGNP